VAPTPPPAEPGLEDELVRAAAARATGRRASHEGSKSREKLPSSSHKPYVVDASPKSSSRGIPALHKSHTSPLTVPLDPSSPPRVGINRSTTTPNEFSTSAPQMPPSFSRTHTWTHGGQEAHDFYPPVIEESDEDRHHRHSRRGSSRRHRSPDTTRYKVEGNKTAKLDSRYSYGESPNSARYMPTDVYDAHPPAGGSYPGYMKVKESRSYGPSDVKYSDYNVSYTRDRYDNAQVFA
jgi:hypothetical protein